MVSFPNHSHTIPISLGILMGVVWEWYGKLPRRGSHDWGSLKIPLIMYSIYHAPRLWHQVCLGGGKTLFRSCSTTWCVDPEHWVGVVYWLIFCLEVRRHSWTWYLGCRLPILAKKWVPLMFSVECADRSLVFTVKLLVLQMSNIYIYYELYV